MPTCFDGCKFIDFCSDSSCYSDCTGCQHAYVGDVLCGSLSYSYACESYSFGSFDFSYSFGLFCSALKELTMLQLIYMCACFFSFRFADMFYGLYVR